MTEDWQKHISRIEELAREKGLKYNRVEFEVVPESFMTEIAIYGLPVRMPHWSFGVRYIYQLIQHRMGLSRLFEVVFPGNPREEAVAAGRRSVDLLRASEDLRNLPYIYVQLARIHLALGELDPALDAIQNIIETPTHFSRAWMKLDPMYRPLRGNARFEAMVGS